MPEHEEEEDKEGMFEGEENADMEDQRSIVSEEAIKPEHERILTQ